MKNAIEIHTEGNDEESRTALDELCLTGAQFSAIQKMRRASGGTHSADLQVDDLGRISVHGGIRFHF